PQLRTHPEQRQHRGDGQPDTRQPHHTRRRRLPRGERAERTPHQHQRGPHRPPPEPPTHGADSNGDHAHHTQPDGGTTGPVPTGRRHPRDQGQHDTRRPGRPTPATRPPAPAPHIHVIGNN